MATEIDPRRSGQIPSSKGVLEQAGSWNESGWIHQFSNKLAKVLTFSENQIPFLCK